MTPAAQPSFLTRVMDIVFGKAATPEERRLFEASRPPAAMERTYSIVLGASLLATLTACLWSYGWLPFVESRISRDWFWLAFGFNLLLRFGWEQVTGFYARRAKAGEALGAKSAE